MVHPLLFCLLYHTVLNQYARVWAAALYTKVTGEKNDTKEKVRGLTLSSFWAGALGQAKIDEL